jgi:hypothetical protein
MSMPYGKGADGKPALSTRSYPRAKPGLAPVN